ncbi:MAG: UDP-N-acetylmuramoyl-L-alanine--D-glutamate ligase [bacterium]|nr:UDP-N-acetylmuramoyl-L-alanine--D-glutamate ligase [bacterium]
MKLNELKDKRILLLGFGREGIDTFLFLRKFFPDKILGIADKNEKVSSFTRAKRRVKKNECSSHTTRLQGKIKWHLGKNYLEALENYDVIIKSPGIPFKILPRTVLGKIITQTDIFFENCPGKIIGITGTKGKSTTTALIYRILKAGGVKAHLVGNIGKPVLNLLPFCTPNDIFVYELSSHQLYNLKKSPHIAVLLNLFQEHLDYYRNFKEYVNAKANIVRYQTKNDYLVYNSADKIVKEIAGKSKTESRNSGTNVKKRTKFSSPAKKIPVKGEYYELDRNAARAVGKIFKIPEKIIERGIKKFKPLPHRLELVGKFKEIIFYNDSLATIPEATIAALDALGDRVETIILGGFDRNINFKNLARIILKSKLKTLILFPTTGEKIRREIIKLGGRASLNIESLSQKGTKMEKNASSSTRSTSASGAEYMRDAVRLAYKHTGKGKICLLSTASASFNLFKDYKERGNLFKKYVKSFSA